MLSVGIFRNVFLAVGDYGVNAVSRLSHIEYVDVSVAQVGELLLCR